MSFLLQRFCVVRSCEYAGAGVFFTFGFAGCAGKKTFCCDDDEDVVKSVENFKEQKKNYLICIIV